MTEARPFPSIPSNCTIKSCGKKLSRSRVNAIRMEREIVGPYPVGIMGAAICSECYEAQYREASAQFYPS